MEKIALILVNYNGRAYLPDLFVSLGKLDFPSDQCAIFFVDNASDDDSLVFAKQHAENLGRVVHFIENSENQGFAGGNNTAIKKALEAREYSYIVLLNNDTVVDPKWLAELINVAERDQIIGAVQSLVLLYHKRDHINTSGNKLHYLGFGWSGDHQEPLELNNWLNSSQFKEIGYASGAAVLYPTHVLEKVGLLDEKFFLYHEDLELSWRIRLAGYKIVLARESRVYHKYEFSRRKKKWLFAERNRLVTIFSLYDIRTILLFTPMFILLEMGILFYSIIDGWFLQKLRSYGEVIDFIPHILEKRRQVAALRKISDKEVLDSMVSTLYFEEVNSPLIANVANPVLKGYFNFVRRFINW